MYCFNMHFSQAQTHNDNRVELRVGFIEVVHIKTPISCARLPIPKEGLAVFFNYPSVTKDQALEETVLTLFQPVVNSCFQLINVAIHDVIKGQLSKVGL